MKIDTRNASDLLGSKGIGPFGKVPNLINDHLLALSRSHDPEQERSWYPDCSGGFISLFILNTLWVYKYKNESNNELASEWIVEQSFFDFSYKLLTIKFVFFHLLVDVCVDENHHHDNGS